MFVPSWAAMRPLCFGCTEEARKARLWASRGWICILILRGQQPAERHSSAGCELPQSYACGVQFQQPKQTTQKMKP